MPYRYKALKIQGKRIDEHRLIMQNVSGRKLGFNEIVHHDDDNGMNNSVDNLKIMTRSEHSKMHWAKGTYNITKENTPARKAARHAHALKVGRRVMICDESGKELMIVRSVRIAARITGTPQSSLWNIIVAGRDIATSPFKFLKP